MIPEDLALKIVRVWLTTDFEGGRHIARIAQLDLLEASLGAASTAPAKR